MNVWWFGGNDGTESIDGNADSCELVAVRIDKTSANSRRIAGDIVVSAPLEDVWAILTDYDYLAVHVPNLVESRIVPSRGRGSWGGAPGDGSYQCRLFQKGAQKIVGFEFGASVTMDMVEQVIVPPNQHNFPEESEHAFYPQERKIGFKCVESPFFSEFDGEWRAKEQRNDMGDLETVLSYEVEVRPRGPVPVAALEWRIREDVPTNLRAVKRSAVEVGKRGVEARQQSQRVPSRRQERAVGAAASSTTTSSPARIAQRAMASVAGRSQQQLQRAKRMTPVPVPVAKASDWFDDETMAAYLKE